VSSPHYKKLSEIVDVLESGSRPKGGVSIDSGDIPSLGAEHLNDEGGFNFSKIKKIENIFYEKMRNGKIKNGDILIVKDGATTGKASFADHDFPFKKAAVNEHVFILRVDNKISSSKYVFHFLRSPKGKGEILSDFRGATVGGISRGFLDKVNVPLPPLAEQQRIASILDKAELVKRKRELAIEKLDELAQSIFIEMFGNPATNPKRWPKKTLSEIVLKITDGEHLNPNFQNNGMPMVMAGNVLDSKVDIDVARFVSYEDGSKFRKKCNPEVGDLLVVSRGATIGRMCVVNETRPFCLMGSVILIKVNKILMDSEFLAAFLKLPVMQKILYKTSGSSAQQAIYLKDLKNIECIIPPLKIQHQFSLVIRDIKRFNDLMAVNKSKIKNLESSLQSQAFSGQL